MYLACLLKGSPKGYTNIRASIEFESSVFTGIYLQISERTKVGDEAVVSNEVEIR